MNNKISQTMTPINGTALLKAFKDKGISPSEVAEQFGYSRNYFQTCASRGVIRTSLAELLWNECNINLDLYAAGEVKTEVQNDELYTTVYKAICDAINDMQGCLFAAFYGALKKIEANKEERY